MQRSSRSSKTIRLSKMIQDVSQRSPAVVAQTQDAHHVRWGPRSKLQLLQHQGQAPQRFQVAHRCTGNLCQFHKMLVKHVGWMNPAQEMSQNAAIESIDSCEMMLLFIPRCGANASMRQYVCWVWHSMAQQWPQKCWIWASYKGHGWAGWWHSIAVVCLSRIWYWIHSSDNSVYSFEDAKFHDVSLFMMIMKQLYFMMRSFMGLPKNTIVYHDWSPTTIYWAPLLDKPTWQVIDSERCAEPLAELKSFCRENRHFHTDLPKRRKRFSQIWEPKKHPRWPRCNHYPHYFMEVRPIPMVADVSCITSKMTDDLSDLSMIIPLSLGIPYDGILPPMLWYRSVH